MTLQNASFASIGTGLAIIGLATRVAWLRGICEMSSSDSEEADRARKKARREKHAAKKRARKEEATIATSTVSIRPRTPEKWP